MSYIVKKQKLKSGKTSWRLQWRQYKGNDAKWRHVPKDEWAPIGFRTDMSLEEAKAHAKHINNKDKFEKLEVKRQKIAKLVAKRELVESVFLPQEMVEEFEEIILLEKIGRGDEANLKYKSTRSHWRMAKKLIAKIKLDPSDWYDRKEKLYIAFRNEKMSIGYVEKVLRLMNEWGYFYCRRMKKAWEKVPRPGQDSKRDIIDANAEKERSGTESEPMDFDSYKTALRNLSKEVHKDWIKVAYWFGLRPIECDRLKLPPTPESKLHRDIPGIPAWAVTIDDKGTEILWIYQTKLHKKFAMKKCWKGIPCVEKEQIEALGIIKKIQGRIKEDKSYNWKRPLTKTLKAAISRDDINVYGPRKNFYSMMKKRGYLAEDIARWMGHTDLRTTIGSYENRTVVTYSKVA